MSEQSFQTEVQVCKLDKGRGLVFGYAVICKVAGEPYFDLQEEHIPEDVMLDFSTDFMLNSRTAKAMHGGEPIGEVIYAFPITTELAGALDIETKKTGLIIGMKPDSENLQKFINGEFRGFSIGGMASYEDAK